MALRWQVKGVWAGSSLRGWGLSISDVLMGNWGRRTDRDRERKERGEGEREKDIDTQMHMHTHTHTCVHTHSQMDR